MDEDEVLVNTYNFLKQVSLQKRGFLFEIKE